MSENEKLLRQAEGLAGFRRIMLVVIALSYVGWIVTFSLGVTGIGNLPHTLLITISLAILPVWAVSMIAFLWGMVRMTRDKKLGALIDDERTRGINHQAIQAGYWGMIVAAGICFWLSFFLDIDIRLVLAGLVGMGVAVPSLTYACLYRG
ncbi:hypothetical protein [Asticcacaulis benevestitus]|uniref:DUF2178 domain-containing protein n=1 Tax=Asticcacaulis benevestitus DSM 16100 = ATCC BAA-896 TaxID=1121022 RepID=V4RPK0_9CAUL|nr:hypothetical protein [Asticcacaulis benevestitus]ESQ93148.1 hypothetical protein ABENE_06260 [Asticcacaulis benevestitus DSM 16100 = ATCC BAA-896]